MPNLCIKQPNKPSYLLSVEWNAEIFNSLWRRLRFVRAFWTHRRFDWRSLWHQWCSSSQWNLVRLQPWSKTSLARCFSFRVGLLDCGCWKWCKTFIQRTCMQHYIRLTLWILLNKDKKYFEESYQFMVTSNTSSEKNLYFFALCKKVCFKFL